MTWILHHTGGFVIFVVWLVEVPLIAATPMYFVLVARANRLNSCNIHTCCTLANPGFCYYVTQYRLLSSASRKSFSKSDLVRHQSFSRNFFTTLSHHALKHVQSRLYQHIAIYAVTSRTPLAMLSSIKTELGLEKALCE